MKRRIGALALAAGLALAQPGQAQQIELNLPAGSDDLRDALTRASLTLSLDEAQTDPAAQDYVAAAIADYRRLLTALYAEGHYGGTISITVDGREAADIAPFDAPARITRIVLDVTPGPRFRFGRAEVAPLAPGTAMPEGFATGEIARADLIRRSVSAAVTGWRDLGHARAAPATEEITAIHPESRLDARVTLAPGPQLTFGALSVTGNEAVRSARIVEIAGLRRDRVFSPAELNRAAARLRRTGAFASVAMIEGDENGPELSLPITVQVVEALPRRIGAGAELSSTEGLTLSAFWLHRNLRGGAERFRIGAEISDIGGGSGGVDYEIALSYGRPATFRSDLDLEVTGRIALLDEETYRTELFEANMALIRYVADDFTLQGGPGIIIAHEETEFRTRDYTLVTFPLRGTLDRRDDPLDAGAGYYLDLDVTPFVNLDGAGDGARLFADARVYRTFGTDRPVTLAARGQFGTVQTGDILDAPADFLFYSGGGGTVRGQPFQSLGVDVARDFGTGPRDARIGGGSFVGAQLEARVGVTDAISLVGFYDWGHVDADPWPTGDGQSHDGAGFGLRYDTGIGPIRLDIATPASGDRAGRDIELYLGIGQAF